MRLKIIPPAFLGIIMPFPKIYDSTNYNFINTSGIYFFHFSVSFTKTRVVFMPIHVMNNLFKEVNAKNTRSKIIY